MTNITDINLQLIPSEKGVRLLKIVWPKQQNYLMLFGQSKATASDYQSNIRGIYDQMLACEASRHYTQAEDLRLKAQQQKLRWQETKEKEQMNKHNQQLTNQQQDYYSKLDECNRQFANKLQDYKQTCRQQIQSIDEENRKQINALRYHLNQNLPSKVKESYQLLNLRQIQEFMNRQKNFPQAHLIQGKIKLQYEQELNAWNNDKQNKIQQAVNNLTNKHAKERDLLNHRIQIQIDCINHNWEQTKLSLLQRFQNNMKELKAKHERQVLSFKRQFTTKGGCFSPKFQGKESMD